MTTTTLSLASSTLADTTTPVASVKGAPHVVLRLEALAVLALSLAAYAHLGASWKLFGALFLAPDLAMLGYLVNPRVGSIAYNTAHSYLAPALLVALGFVLSAPALLPLAALWSAHIGFDRALGYGLKYATHFGHTHLGSLNKAPSQNASA